MRPMEPKDNPGNPTSSGLVRVGPGLYSLPDELGARPVTLSEEYKQYLKRMWARGNPIAYVRAILKE